MTVAAALMAIVLTAAYLCLSAGVAAQRLIDPRIEAVQSARVALGLMTADLRCACPLSKEVSRRHEARPRDVEAANTDFGTHNYTPARVGEGDFCQTSYFVDVDPETGGLVLWRRRNPRSWPSTRSPGAVTRKSRAESGSSRSSTTTGSSGCDSRGDADGRDRKQTSDRTHALNLCGSARGRAHRAGPDPRDALARADGRR